ncbi:hypothetical protein F2Q70_00008975 [Brassica cretica]|uniref:Secreted protein n=1 Tax=Brassica cretica TaxID=69181 RepID=A0A8S9M4N0_BRACR|nr:hypothetical protein F2Q70_00008975 [Brassica cretica]
MTHLSLGRMTWLVRLLAPWSIQTILSRIGDATSSPSGVCLEARLTACISHFWWSEREVVYAKVLVPQASYSLLWPLQFMAGLSSDTLSEIALYHFGFLGPCNPFQSSDMLNVGARFPQPIVVLPILYAKQLLAVLGSSSP